MSYDVNALRAKEFPWTLNGEQTFLDNAKTGALTASGVTTLKRGRICAPSRFGCRRTRISRSSGRLASSWRS